MKSSFVKRCVVSPKVQKETERHRRYLQNLVKQHRITQEALAERLGWAPTSLSEIFHGQRTFRVKYLLAILDELGVEPGEFFAGLYPESPIRRGQGSSLVNRYENAIEILGSFPELVPGTPGFKTLYVERAFDEATFINRARGAHRARRAFHGLVAGHRGVGVSTEVHRLLATSKLVDLHATVVLDVPNPVSEQGLLWAIAAACASLVWLGQEDIPAKLTRHLEAWDIRPETADPMQVSLLLERGAGPPAEGDPAKAPALPELINQVGKVVSRKLFVRPLVILDGFAQWNIETLTNRLEESLHAIEHPAISTVLLLPASLLYRPLEGRIGPRTMIVPPVPICHGIVDQEHVSEAGLIFFDEVIRRYLPIVQMTEEAREALCLLSAGLPGEMLALTRDACVCAAKTRSNFVDMAAAKKVWEERTSRWRGVFSRTERDRLRHLMKEPFDEGVEGIAGWLHQNAVLLQPEHGGWLSVHPALRRMLREKR